MRSPRSCSTAAPIFARCRRCSVTPTSRRRRSIRTSPRGGSARCIAVSIHAMLMLAGAPIFGYARPVPVDFGRLRNPRRDMVLVALAGPGTNLILAALSALVLHLLLPHISREAVQTDSWLVTNFLLPLGQ